MNIWMISMYLLISLTMVMSLIFFFSQINFFMKKKYNSQMMYTKKEKFLSLFVSFNPQTSIWIFLKLDNWMIMIFATLYLFLSFWTIPNRYSTMLKTLINNLKIQLEISLKTKKDSSSMIFITIFLFIFLSNILGLIPNLFTSTSHMTTNLLISIPFWLGFLMFGWILFTTEMLAHLVPNGTPFPLISFMILIELISLLIRPLTLSIRLMANMVSGHLLLTLLGNAMESSSMIFIFISIIIQTLLFSLESGVAAIQAYVFCMLLSLYSDESDWKPH